MEYYFPFFSHFDLFKLTEPYTEMEFHLHFFPSTYSRLKSPVSNQ